MFIPPALSFFKALDEAFSSFDMVIRQPQWPCSNSSLICLLFSALEKHGRHSRHSYTDIPVIYEDSDFDNESKTACEGEYALILVMMETDFAEGCG